MAAERAKGTPDRRRPEMEELEPRLLFSADAVAALIDDALVQPYVPESRVMDTTDADPAAGSALAAQSQRREIVFIDPATPDAASLLEDLRAQSTAGRQIEVVVLDAARDGIEQITEHLAGRSDIDAVHLVSHGSEGGVQLGSTWLGSGNLDAYSDSIAAWSDTLGAKADLLIYGCNLAGSEDGARLVDRGPGLLFQRCKPGKYPRHRLHLRIVDIVVAVELCVVGQDPRLRSIRSMVDLPVTDPAQVGTSDFQVDVDV